MPVCLRCCYCIFTGTLHPSNKRHTWLWCASADCNQLPTPQAYRHQLNTDVLPFTAPSFRLICHLLHDDWRAYHIVTEHSKAEVTVPGKHYFWTVLVTNSVTCLCRFFYSNSYLLTYQLMYSDLMHLHITCITHAMWSNKAERTGAPLHHV